MLELDFFLSLEKLFILARGLDEFMDDHYTLLLKGDAASRKRQLSIIYTTVSAIRSELQRLAMIDPQFLLRDCLDSHGLPVDNAADSGYDNHEKQT